MKKQKEQVVVLKDTNDYDNKGNVVVYEGWEPTEEIVEPYDPAYLGDSVEVKAKLSAAERKEAKMLTKLEKALNIRSIAWTWDGWFVVNHGNRVLWVCTETWQYCFGTPWETIDWDEDVAELLDRLKLDIRAKVKIGGHVETLKLRRKVSQRITMYQLLLDEAKKLTFLSPMDAENQKEKIERITLIENNRRFCQEMYSEIKLMKETNKLPEEK